MKGLSVIFTILLLVLATHLANRMRAAGKLPVDDSQPGPAATSFAKGPAANKPIRL